MVNGIRTSNPHGFNKGFSLKFHEGSQVRQTPEEGWRAQQPKHCGNNNNNEDNSPKTLNDKSHQASSQKFRQVIVPELICLYTLLWFQVLLFYSILMICLHTVKWFQV